MLAKSFSFYCKNETGAVIAPGDVDISYNPYKFGTDGALVYGTPQSLSNSASILDGDSVEVGTVNNSSELAFGAHLNVTFAGTAGATGKVTLYIRQLNADQDTDALFSITDITTFQKIVGVEI